MPTRRQCRRYQLEQKRVLDNPGRIKHLRFQVQSSLVKKHSYLLQYVRKQTRRLCLRTIKRDPSSLQYIRNQTLEVCLRAVQTKVKVHLPKG